MKRGDLYLLVIGEGSSWKGPARDFPIRIHVYPRSQDSGGLSLMRLTAKISRLDGKTVKTVNLVGFREWRPLALFGETTLPPGEYMASVGEVGDGTRFRVLPGGGSPVYFCGHDGHRTEILTRSILDGKGRILYGGQDLVIWPCCEEMIQTWEAQDSFGLALYLPGKGGLEVLVNGTSWRVEAGEYLVINPLDRVQISDPPSWPVRLSTVIMEQPALRRFRESVGLRKELGPFQFSPGPRPLRDRLASAVKAWAESWQFREHLGYEEYVGLATERIFLDLINFHPHTFKGSALRGHPTRRMDSRIRSVLEMMEHHMDRDLRVTVMAREIGVSPSWLAHAFAMETRRSPAEYLRALRMRKAAELLKDSRRPVEEVARAVGYRDIGAFRKVFREYAHANPRSSPASD